MRRDHLLGFIAAALCMACAMGVGLLLSQAQPHEAVRLAPHAQAGEVAGARPVTGAQSSSPAEAAARKTLHEGDAPPAPEALPEGHASGDDGTVKYGFREEEGTLRRFVVVQDPSAALSPFSGPRRP